MAKNKFIVEEKKQSIQKNIELLKRIQSLKKRVLKTQHLKEGK